MSRIFLNPGWGNPPVPLGARPVPPTPVHLPRSRTPPPPSPPKMRDLLAAPTWGEEPAPAPAVPASAVLRKSSLKPSAPNTSAAKSVIWDVRGSEKGEKERGKEGRIPTMKKWEIGNMIGVPEKLPLELPLSPREIDAYWGGHPIPPPATHSTSPRKNYSYPSNSPQHSTHLPSSRLPRSTRSTKNRRLAASELASRQSVERKGLLFGGKIEGVAGDYEDIYLTPAANTPTEDDLADLAEAIETARVLKEKELREKKERADRRMITGMEGWFGAKEGRKKHDGEKFGEGAGGVGELPAMPALPKQAYTTEDYGTFRGS